VKGADAEHRALAHLQDAGHELLSRNYRVRGGEIDLITRHAGVIVFTEVKHRTRAEHGDPLESITPRKAALLRRAALQYLLRHFGTDDVRCRFDVVSITGSVGNGRLVHIESAL